jgi:hypothetical protein
VSDEKTNMREPLLTHRKKLRWRRNRGVDQVPGTKTGGSLRSSSARERPACCPGGVRCIGGVSSSQALAWNRRTCRLGTVGQSKGARRSPGREREDPKRQTPQGAEYREAQGRDGPYER